jgi:hypothetical protein
MLKRERMRMSDYGEWVKLRGMNLNYEVYQHGATNIDKLLNMTEDVFADPELDYLVLVGTMHGKWTWRMRADRKATRWTIRTWVIGNESVKDVFDGWCGQEKLPSKIRDIVCTQIGGMND